MLLRITATLAACALAAPTQAQRPAYYQHDLDNCRFNNGQPMDAAECKAIRQKFTAEAAKAAKQAAEAKAASERFEVEQHERQEKVANDRAAMSKAREAQTAKQTAELERARALVESDEREYEAELAAAQAARKKRCGDDYKKPRMGMSMERVHECVSQSFRLTARSQTTHGEVLTFQAPGGYIHAMDGKVIGWGYTRP